MLNKTRSMLLRCNLPEFLDPDSEFLGLAIAGEPEAFDHGLRKAASRALREQSVFAAKFDAPGEGVGGLAILTDPHVAGGDARDFSVCSIQHFCRGEPGVDV